MFCNYGEGEIIMIARIWRGETAPEKANKYFEYLQATGLKEYQDTPGNQGVFVLRRIHDRRAEFLLLSLWNRGMLSAPSPEMISTRRYTIQRTKLTCLALSQR